MPAADSGQRRSALVRSAWVRYALVFVVAFVGLAALGGAKTFAPSRDNHFSHLAQAWTQGRLHHDGKPPGYCDARRRARKECKHHSYDDWAVVWTLELEDGTTVRGYPCRTPACKERKKRERIEGWWVVGDDLRFIPRGEIARRSETWYVTFPPGPALFFLPFVLIWGVGIWDPLLTVIAGALIPVVLVRMLDRERGVEEGKASEHLLLAVAWSFASPACFLAANGRVWFTAQVFGALMLMAYLDAVWRLRRPTLAGLFLALAVACRPTLALAVVVFGGQWLRGGRKWQTLAKFAGPILLVGGALMALNLARFDDPFEFGHRYLDIRWQVRMQEYGLFAADYLGRNLRCLLALLPVSDPEFPWFKVSLHGSALWLTTPWLLAFPLARQRFEGRLELLVGALLVALPPLLYQNSGQLQFTYRFAVDWLPMLIVALALGGVARRRRLFAVLVAWGLLLQSYGAYQFSRKPGRLFVTEPLGWPFEQELEDL